MVVVLELLAHLLGRLGIPHLEVLHKETMEVMEAPVNREPAVAGQLLLVLMEQPPLGGLVVLERLIPSRVHQ